MDVTYLQECWNCNRETSTMNDMCRVCGVYKSKKGVGKLIPEDEIEKKAEVEDKKETEEYSWQDVMVRFFGTTWAHDSKISKYGFKDVCILAEEVAGLLNEKSKKESQFIDMMR